MTFDEEVLENYQLAYEKSRNSFYEKTHSLDSAIKIQNKLSGRVSPNLGNIKGQKKYKRKRDRPGKPCSEKQKMILSKANGKSVMMYDYYTKEPLMQFDSAMKASEYLIKTGKTKNKSSNHRILSVCELNDLKYHAYGYSWKFI